jgi:putative FmdB family regulatory protein
MPIYAYRCASCGHAQDVLQKLADAPLTVCPACGADSFRKQLTAAGFQLKGSGWYATDFKGNGSAKPAGDGAKPGADKADTSTTEKATPGKSGDAPAAASGGAAAKTQAGGCGTGCACH